MFVNRSVYFVAIGSNVPIGGALPKNTVSAALTKMQEAGLVIRAVSRFFATPSFPPGSGPDFVNAVVSVRSDAPAKTVLARLHDIEAAFDRRRDTRWAARTLDLDLIAAGDGVIPDAETVTSWINLPPQEQMETAPDRLLLPHPRMQDRGFVLVPLCDIAPDWQHPVLRQSARALLAALPDDQIQEIRAI